jgi:ubiquinone/menaquinone biosynthesis C-methylase UbiE
MDYIKQNKEIYNKIAPLFSATRQYLWDDFEVFKKYLKDNISVLDIGCGTGRLYHFFKEFQDVQYVGLDQSEGQIKMAQKDFPQNDYIVAEMTELPFADSSFDFVFCVATLHHLPSEELRKKALSEMSRVLKKDAYVFLTNWNLFSDTTKKIVDKGKFKVQNKKDFFVPWISPEGIVLGERYYYAFDLEELKKISLESGFEVLENFFIKKGKKSNQKKANNIITILKKIS